MRDIVANTSFLIAVEKLSIENEVGRLYKRILIPAAVASEFGSAPPYVQVHPDTSLPWLKLLREDLNLGPGESSAISLAHEKELPVLIDDQRARKIAMHIGLHVSGTIGVLLKIQHSGVEGFSAYEHARRLRTLGFHISDSLLESIRNF